MIRTLAVAATLAAATAVAPVPGAVRDVAHASVKAAEKDRIDVTGEGRVPVRPDIMYVRAGVEVRRAKAGDAYRAAADAGATLVKVIVESGVKRADVSTTDLAVQPEYGNEDPRRIVGYRGTESVSAVVRDLPRAHETLNAIMAAGPDMRLDGVTFDKADTSAELAEAERLAIADARARAERAAKAAGRGLGRVLKISLSTVDAIPTHFITKASIADSGGHLAPGEGVQRVTANVTYALK